MDVSVVIATYNRKNILEKCLECLFNQDYPRDKYQIVVVDDGSTDGTDRMVKQKKDKCKCSLIYSQSHQREGQSKARNKGILLSEGKVIIFIDSDSLAPPWFIKEHLRMYKDNPNIIVDGPAITVTGENNLINPPFCSPLIRTLAFLDFGGAVFITANTSCLKENLIKAGRFDEEFGKGFGWLDRELGLRLIKMGLKRVKNRRAYVLHYQIEKKNLTFLAKKRKDRGENAILYYKKHPVKKVKKEARFHYLFYDKILNKLGWTEKYLTEKYLSFLYQKKSIRYPLFKKFYLIHCYAEGLKSGIEKYKVRIK